MKIAIITYHFLPNWLGGIEIATYHLAKQLAKRGHEIHIIVLHDKKMAKESKENGFYVHRIAFKKILFFGIVLSWLKALINLRKIDPDVIHVQSIGVGVPAYLAKLFMRKPYVVWGHGFDVYFPWRFKKIIAKIVIKNADVVIALSENMRDKIKEIYRRDIKIIPNGIDMELFRDESEHSIHNNDKKLILFVGSLRPVKGVIYLIEAMNIIRQDIPEVRLLIVGDGEDKKKLTEFVEKSDLKKYVHFAGKIENEKIPAYMAKSDVFVLPSLSEGFGIVVIEAMASGLPIIATNVGGLPDIIKDGENGFLIQPKRPEEIAKKINIIFKNDKLREKIRKNNKEKSKKYSWNIIAKDLEDIYQCK